MRRTAKFVGAALVGVVCAVAIAWPAAAALVSVSNRTDSSGTLLDWQVLGAAGTPVPSGTAVSVVGVQMTISTGLGGPMSREDQAPCGQDQLDFFPCERLLSTNLTPLTALGPIIFQFDHPVSGFGLNIGTHGLGAYAAFLDAYRGDVFLGEAFLGAPGFEHGTSDGSAPFIGLLSDNAVTDFDKLTLDQTGAPPSGWFAVNGPIVRTRASAVPEPATATFLAAAVAALAAIGARTRSRTSSASTTR